MSGTIGRSLAPVTVLLVMARKLPLGLSSPACSVLPLCGTAEFMKEGDVLQATGASQDRLPKLHWGSPSAGNLIGSVFPEISLHSCEAQDTGPVLHL